LDDSQTGPAIFHLAVLVGAISFGQNRLPRAIPSAATPVAWPRWPRSTARQCRLSPSVSIKQGPSAGRVKKPDRNPNLLGAFRRHRPGSHAPSPRSHVPSGSASLCFCCSIAVRAASDSASLRSASAFDCCAAWASAFACCASLVACAASSFACFRFASVSASLR